MLVDRTCFLIFTAFVGLESPVYICHFLIGHVKTRPTCVSSFYPVDLFSGFLFCRSSQQLAAVSVLSSEESPIALYEMDLSGRIDVGR